MKQKNQNKNNPNLLWIHAGVPQPDDNGFRMVANLVTGKTSGIIGLCPWIGVSLTANHRATLTNTSLCTGVTRAHLALISMKVPSTYCTD